MITPIVGDVIPFRGFSYRVKNIEYVPPSQPDEIYVKLVRINPSTGGGMNCKHCLNRTECAYREHLFKFKNASYIGDVVILGGRLFKVENIKPWEIKLKPAEVNK